MGDLLEYLGENPVVVCAIISVFDVILSALISYKVSRKAANDRIEELKLTWAKEDNRDAREKFGEMSAAVGTYSANQTSETMSSAAASVAREMAMADGELVHYLSELYSVIQDEGTSYCVDVALGKAIAQYQKQRNADKSEQHTSPRNEQIAT